MSFNLTWIGQGGFILQIEDKKLCIDPYLSNSVFHLDGFQRVCEVPILPEDLDVDVIVCTHDHIDHLDEDSLKYTDMEHIFYVGPSTCQRHFKAFEVHDNRILPLNRGEEISIGDSANVIGVYADHTEDSIGIIVKYKGITLYFVGDSLYSEKLKDVKSFKPDILITCINGKLGNMDYSEAAKLATELHVKTAVPCHYGMFAENTEDPKNFKRALKGSSVKYFELEFNKEYPIEDMI
ncbi:MAG TPA: MBL fold metallo-hydrolase [Ruminiclostridium sp.]